jgi:hypothetical protein
MSTTDVAKARADFERAERRATEARRKAERAAALDAERRAQREERFDRATLELYDGDALDEAISEAQRAFEAALQADPVIRAAVDLRRILMRRRLADELRVGIASRLYGEAPSYSVPPTDVIVGDRIERFVERRGSELAHAEVEQWWKAREEAASN